MLLLQTVASQNWRLQNFDITTAFLRGRADGRELAMEPVPELKQLLHMSEGEICLLEGNAYGRVDAPLLFYKEFRRHLEGVGFEAHPLDNCLYLLRNKQNPAVLDGILGAHVDDGRNSNNTFLSAVESMIVFGSQVWTWNNYQTARFLLCRLRFSLLGTHTPSMNGIVVFVRTRLVLS